jgi:hypothetical protein
VFENRVLRRIVGTVRDEVMEGWRKLHNEELHNLYSSSNIIRMIKSRRIRWTGHIACIAERRNAYRILMERPEGKRPLGRPRLTWEDIKWILERQDGVVWTGLFWLRIGTSGGL